MAGPPALDEEELSSEDEEREEQEGDDYESDGDEGGEVNVGLGGLDMRERNSDVENHMVSQRRNGGKRSGEEYLSGEAETEEEDFSSPPAKVVTPSKRRVIVSESFDTPICVFRSNNAHPSETQSIQRHDPAFHQPTNIRIPNSCCCSCCCSLSQKPTHGDILGTKCDKIDPLLSKRPEKF